jgi:hypothetical protein
MDLVEIVVVVGAEAGVGVEYKSCPSLATAVAVVVAAVVAAVVEHTSCPSLAIAVATVVEHTSCQSLAFAVAAVVEHTSCPSLAFAVAAVVEHTSCPSLAIAVAAVAVDIDTAMDHIVAAAVLVAVDIVDIVMDHIVLAAVLVAVDIVDIVMDRTALAVDIEETTDMHIAVGSHTVAVVADIVVAVDYIDPDRQPVAVAYTVVVHTGRSIVTVVVVVDIGYMDHTAGMLMVDSLTFGGPPVVVQLICTIRYLMTRLSFLLLDLLLS